MVNEKLQNLIRQCRSLDAVQKSVLLKFLETADEKTVQSITRILTNENILQNALINFVNEEKIKAAKEVVQEFECKEHEDEIVEAENLIRAL